MMRYSADSVVYRKSHSAQGAGQVSRNRYPVISWLKESWLKRVIPYERIATASPKQDAVASNEPAIAHHISSLPNLEGPSDLVLVINQDGQQVRYRMKARTWPLLKHEMLKVKEFAA